MSTYFNALGMSLDDVKQYLEIPVGVTARDVLVARLTRGALDFSQRRTKRVFSTGVATQYFSGNDRGYLVLPDFQAGSVSAVSFLNPDGTAWRNLETTEWRTFGATQSPSIHYRIELVNPVSENPHRIIGRNPYVFPRATANVGISASWGSWGVLPDGLVNLVLDMIKVKYGKPGNVRSVSSNGESISYSERDVTDEMREGFNEYKRYLVDVF